MPPSQTHSSARLAQRSRVYLRSNSQVFCSNMTSYPALQDSIGEQVRLEEAAQIAVAAQKEAERKLADLSTALAQSRYSAETAADQLAEATENLAAARALYKEAGRELTETETQLTEVTEKLAAKEGELREAASRADAIETAQREAKLKRHGLSFPGFLSPWGKGKPPVPGESPASLRAASVRSCDLDPLPPVPSLRCITRQPISNLD